MSLQTIRLELGLRHRRSATGPLLALLLIFPLGALRGADAPLPAADPEEVGLSSERLSRIHTALQRYIDDNKLAGAVTLVARKGRVVHFQAQGVMDIESKKPMQKDTLFRMASTTKPVTSVAILMLMEEGKLRLNDPVSRFLPEFKDMKVAVSKGDSSEFQLVPQNIYRDFENAIRQAIIE
jgi:CubicO group peptidase (beta-lactamase class C family)